MNWLAHTVAKQKSILIIRTWQSKAQWHVELCQIFFHSLINLEIFCVFSDVSSPVIVSKPRDDSLIISWVADFQMSLSTVPYI